MFPDLPEKIDHIRGFLAKDKGLALYRRHALSAAALGPVLEVGSYCGKSTTYLGLACRERRGTLYALDHHRGSEEHQPGESYHDPALFDPDAGHMDTLPEFRRNMRSADLEDVVVPLLSSSAVVARHWLTPLAMVFIDGGHSLEAALTDYRCWSANLLQGGLLAMHDLFPDPASGGQAPCTIYRLALDSGLFEELERINTLGVLRRL